MRRRPLGPLFLLLVLGGGLLLCRVFAPAPAPAVGADTVRRAFAARRSGIWVEVEGRVVRLLPDDTRPPRHQRFILDLGGHTLLVSHNIDLAPRAPVRVGDRVRVRGRYEWNRYGGLLHWTHADPRGRRRGGWIRHAGRSYR